MANSQNFIIINGKKYDAVTGVMLGASQQNLAKPVVDGFVRRSKDTSQIRTTAHGVKQHSISPQKSKTLMRAAVKKPQQLHIAPQPAATARPQAKTIFGKAVITPRVQATPEHRQKLAQSTPKSTQVHKFVQHSEHGPVAKIMPLEVRPAPALDIPHIQSAPKTITAKKTDLLERALEAAEGHKEPFFEHKKSMRHKISKKIGVSSRAIAIASTVFVGLVGGGLYAYQNVPKLALKVAASRAGIDASMPNYSPSGFSFNGPVQYSSGQVVVGFKSNTDDRNYKLTQQSSTWSSDSLLNNFIINSNKQYQTYQDRGRTIYIYDGNNATWVDGGIWYQIEGKSQLNSDQLVRIAASL